jgi:hypothetical protein
MAELATGDIGSSTVTVYPIRVATQVCRQRLRACTSHATLTDDHWAETRFSDFNLWVSGVGASADDLNCLDKRLERDVPAQKVVIGVLSTLAAWTMVCMELAETKDFKMVLSGHQLSDNLKSASDEDTDSSDEITLDEAKVTIEGLLKSLVELEAAIRRASMASRLRRADRTFQRRKDQYMELSDHLRFILRVSEASSRERVLSDQRLVSDNIDATMVSPTFVPSDAYWQSHDSANQPSALIRHDELKLDHLLGNLQGNKTFVRPEQEVLILANIKRTDRFIFHKNRQEQLRPEKAEKSAADMREQVQSHRTRPPDTQLESGEQRSHSTEPLLHENARVPSSQHSSGTTNQASDFEPKSSLENAAKIKNPVAAPAIAATTIALRADYPKPPKDKTRCPYCLIPFRSEANNMLQWK